MQLNQMSNPQIFQWIAISGDNTYINEFNPDHSENSYATLPRENIIAFGLRSAKSSYIIDLSTGYFHANDWKGEKVIKSTIVVDDNVIELNDNASTEQSYEFFQYKSASNEIASYLGLDEFGNIIMDENGQPVFFNNLAPMNLSGYGLGWYTYKELPHLGWKHIQSILELNNVDHPTPQLKIILSDHRILPHGSMNGVATDGSPFHIMP